MRLLIVDDDLSIRTFLCRSLSEAGYSVFQCSDGAIASRMMAAEHFDLVIVDWTLPGKSGIDLLCAARERGWAVPIILLAGNSTVENRVRALKAGADDFVAKPFEFDELIARIRMILRRSAQQPGPMLHCADLTLDLRKRVASRAGAPIRLTAREFALLQLLLEHSGVPLSREHIRNCVWRDEVEIISNVVDVYIRHLRAKVDRPDHQRLIFTVRGVGYGIKSSA